MKIVFVHNVYNRPKTLLETIQKEIKHFPESEFVIAYNNDINIDTFKQQTFGSRVHPIYFTQRPHKIGCVNGFALGVKKALSLHPDVIIFSHDDVSISEDYIDVYKHNISLVGDGCYDIVCRSPKFNYGTNYFMMEGIFMNGSFIKVIETVLNPIKEESQIPKDIRNSYSPEVFLFNCFNNKTTKILNHQYDNSSDTFYNKQLGEKMGMYHKNIGIRGWNE
jgi:hypothetical protein